MNEYVRGSNIWRAFILWGNSAYCTLFFLFFYIEREKKKKKKTREKKEKEEEKNLDPFSACFGRKRKNVIFDVIISSVLKWNILEYCLMAKEKKKRKKI